ncbi:MAG: toxin-antitoxin system HicB family antitoxin [Holophagales bacterium]|nr:toxin-antitoxin system HicB family antitoxin [Holophagales bacterium]
MPSNASKPPHRRHSTSLQVRLLEEHKKTIAQAADHAGASLSDWVRMVLLREARKELGKE